MGLYVVCRFVWRKKIERDVSQGVPLDTFSVKAEKKRQKERMVRLYTLRSFLCIINHIDTMTCDCDIKSIFFHKCLFKSMLQAEIEKVKKRREERAIEKAQHEKKW